MSTKNTAATTPVEKPAETPALDLSFEDADVPSTTRIPKANPYSAAVAELKATMTEGAERSTKAKATVLPADAVASHVILMQKAGRSNGVTVRNNQRAIEEGDRKGQVRVTFWTVPAITRKAADKPAEA